MFVMSDFLKIVYQIKLWWWSLALAGNTKLAPEEKIPATSGCQPGEGGHDVTMVSTCFMFSTINSLNAEFF